MKNSFKITALVLFVAVVGFSSCVKTDVAPEVSALRQSQVDKLKADIAAILASNSLKVVQTRQLRMQTTFDSLNKAYQLKQSEAQYEVTLANIENQLEIEKRFLAQNQLNTAQAIANYERFIASGQFQQNVSDLLGKYSNETNVLNQLYSDRVYITKQIATEQLLLTASTHLSWDFLKAALEVQLTDKNAELAAANAALTALQGVLDDPTTIGSTKTALAIQIADLVDQNKALDVDVQEATNAYNAAAQAVTDAENVILLMDKTTSPKGYVQQIKDKNADIVTKNAEIVAANTAVSNATAALVAPTAALALANADQTAATSANASAMTAYNTKLAAWNTADATKNNAQNDVDTKTVLVTIAQNNLNADPTNVALQAALTSAQAALTAANTVLATATTAEAAALTAKNDAYNVVYTAVTGTLAKLTTAQGVVTTAQGALATAQSNLASAQATLTTKNNELAALNTDLTILTANKANIQATYDAAVLNLPALKIAANTANNAKTKVVADEAANNTMQASLNAVLTLLGTELTNITTALATQKTAVQTIKDAIALLQTQIGQNAYNKTESEGKIAHLQQVLAFTNAKITESEAIVANWKKLLDEAIAAG
jgi:chromosome segregation ATPase